MCRSQSLHSRSLTLSLSCSPALLHIRNLALPLSISRLFVVSLSSILALSLMYSLAHLLSWILAISLSLSVFLHIYIQHTSAQSQVCCSVSQRVAVALLHSGNLAFALCLSHTPHQSASPTDAAAGHASEQAPPNHCTWAAPLHSAPPVRVCVCMCVCSVCL